MSKDIIPYELARITPILRGLLANDTGEPDVPHAPVILESLANQEARDFAASPENTDPEQYPAQLTRSDSPPLFIDSIYPDSSADAARKEFTAALDKYLRTHNKKPDITCIKGLGILCTEKKDDTALPLANKVALVTGAAGAIGNGICRGLLENGCRVAASDLPGDKLDKFAADLNEYRPGKAIGVPIDVTKAESMTAGFEQIIRTWGGIDIAVVNAGIPLAGQLKDIHLTEFQKLEQVNIDGTLLTIQETAKHFILQATGGDIVIISTKNVPSPGAGFGAYSATKAACHQLGRIASLELAQFGVRVNMVAPDAVFAEGKYKSGLWATVGPDRMKARGLDEKGLAEYYRNRNLLKIQVTGKHVANAVLFLVTRQTPTTGITIPVDGGLPDATPR